MTLKRKVSRVRKQPRRPAAPRALRVTIERETDGRWLADVHALPGVMAYGATQKDAVREVQALALEVLADEVRHGERPIKSLPLFLVTT